MESPQINVAIAELTFNLFQRPIHPELFKIYSGRSIHTKMYEAQLWITGCTHVVSVFADNHCLTELISAPGQMLPQRGLVERFRFRGPRTHKCSVSKSLSYMTNFQVEKMSPKLYCQSHRDLEKFAEKRGMFVKFPHLQTQGMTPFCFLDYEARANELHLHSFSAYPEQATIVKTQSLFDLH